MNSLGTSGQVKSLGGWGGDFVLVTRLRSSEQWLKQKGLQQSFLSKNWDLSAPRIGHNIW